MERLNTPLFRNLAYVLARRICKNYLRFIYRSLNTSSAGGVKDASVCLLLLRNIQKLSPVSCRELLDSFDFSLKHLPALLHKRKGKKASANAVADTRTLMTEFLLGFMCSNSSDSSLKMGLVSAALKLFHAIFKGFDGDSEESIKSVLKSLQINFLSDEKITKSSRIALFSVKSLENASLVWVSPIIFDVLT